MRDTEAASWYFHGTRMAQETHFVFVLGLPDLYSDIMCQYSS